MTVTPMRSEQSIDEETKRILQDRDDTFEDDWKTAVARVMPFCGIVVLDNLDLCAAKVGAKFCFDSNFKDERELVIFDDAPKFEIRVPISASDILLPHSTN